jgi:transposase
VSWEPLESIRQSAGVSGVTGESANTRREPARRTTVPSATILGTVGDVARFPSKARFASYSGTAPVEASSGKVVRHSLSLGGNRHLNYALHMVATSQARSDAPGGTCYRKKLDEGKSSKEALRCLKRRVCDAVYRSLPADS